MSLTEEQLARLPKYARDHIRNLERDLERAHAKIQAGPLDSNVTLDPYSESYAQPLGKDVTIRFGDEGGTNYTVKFNGEREQLQIHAHGQKYGDRLVILPSASNSLFLGHAPVEY